MREVRPNDPLSKPFYIGFVVLIQFMIRANASD